ncbi:MAG: DHH family phosphoesterase [Eubacterium sp.]|nr:DHH family phosphoesterase [Candidatus Colimonas fimequi]
MYVGRLEKLLAMYTPLPMITVNMQGKVTRASEAMTAVFKYSGIVGADIFTLTRLRMAEIIEAAENHKNVYYHSADKYFRIMPTIMGDEENGTVLMYFIDITSWESLKDLYQDNMVCVGIVNIDNYDELTASTGDDGEMNVAAEIDKKIRAWAGANEAAVARYREHMYEVIFPYKKLRVLRENKFDILDTIKEIETTADFPVTLSIGVGINGKSIAECEDYADAALDMALGRGGDQAIVKNINELEYYGGKSQSVEKNNKGKSRVIAHALKALIKQSSKIFIMGHKNPDMDCFGASMGINCIARSLSKETYIVLGDYNDALTAIAEDAKECAEFNIISPERAHSLADEDSLLVIVDVHRPGLVECMDLVENISRKVIVDHHRMAEDCITGLALSYMESYASSASELVSEMVQYACGRRALTTMEANGLLAGIMVDTNRFAVKAGVRTFEAASWLRRSGADLEQVRKYFQGDSQAVRLKAMCIANAEFFDDGIVMSVLQGRNENAQILNSQIADELLTVKGVKASFVAGMDEYGRTAVSARSLGEINVQMVMEKFGGGGHLNTAGVQVDIPPQEILAGIREYLTSILEAN